MLAVVDTLEDIAEAEEFRARAAALEEYLARRAEDAAPARTLLRHLEARIGALLGLAEHLGNKAVLHEDVKQIHHTLRHDFRLLDRYRDVWADAPGRPRYQLLHDIERHRRKVVDADTRAIVIKADRGRAGAGHPEAG